MTITLIDETDDSLTISWPAVKDASCYVLQYCRADNSGHANSEYETLSDKLTSTQAKKKNLRQDEGPFFFRVGAVLKESDGASSQPTSWVTHSEAFQLLTSEEEKSRPLPPTVMLAGAHEALIVSWKPHDGASDYSIQMRDNTGGSEWVTIAANFSNTQVKKRNLSSPAGYQFRVRPNLGESTQLPFSSPSNPVVAIGLSDGIKRLFRSLENGTLLKDSSSQSAISLVDALGGKEFVLLYASASWCGPCRQFTPMLSKWYNSLGPNKTVEVVFLSADHDGNSFKSYYSHMPWLAVAHEEDTREELMSHIRVKGIPHLAVLDARTGRIIEDNAVGKSLDINRWRALV